MTLLILGLILFLGTHSARVFGEGPRAALHARLGELGYKGAYSVASLAGLVLIVVGYGATRENPQIVGQACYFVDPGTNLAETAFMVHPQWQGSGLGTALQRCMAAHARQRGVRGFVAEILADNEKMIRLARGGSTALGNISVENAGSTVRVTTSF